MELFIDSVPEVVGITTVDNPPIAEYQEADDGIVLNVQVIPSVEEAAVVEFEATITKVLLL